ncbi:FAD-containing oxidoreductase [Cupriavidus pampae]|uniref:Dihydrolipoyl dehydrogenase n=1 Tax=Cupriavidus pampae TaxID=659251 RepID=A0ABN7Z2W8_9BURK|nr:FAD-containing oxidoreductase [Cupriavidus pampae]CAG9180324.1 Dihydrolipoyl dehydrogenase [Cupriavidus pampae]
MTAPERFDAILIGTGQAAPALANRLSAAGMAVAVIERGDVGGTCVNVGCTPTKAMVASAYAARMAARAAEYGVVLEGKLGVDMEKVHARTQGIVLKSRNGVTRWIESMARAQLIRGHARFEDARTVRVGDRLLTADKIFLNVGGRALVPDAIRGLSTVPHLTNVEALALDIVPRHLVVIGGSYVGLEFAQVFRRFGAQVTVVERGERLISREDVEVSAQVREILEAEGIHIRTDANCITVAAHAEGVEVGVDCESGEPAVVGSHVLVAVGRRPNTDDLGLDKAGVKTDAHGYVVVDDTLRTSVDGIWALGDCNGRGAFTHTAYNDFEIVAANLLDGEHRLVTERIPVYGLFTDPPLGRVGMTEAQARQAGHRVRVGKRPMTRVMRTVERGESQGSMRVVVDADTDRILGAAILGVGGDEAVHSILSIMAADAPSALLARTMAIHPTVAELIPTILGELGSAS